MNPWSIGTKRKSPNWREFVGEISEDEDGEVGVDEDGNRGRAAVVDLFEEVDAVTRTEAQPTVGLYSVPSTLSRGGSGSLSRVSD